MSLIEYVSLFNSCNPYQVFEMRRRYRFWTNISWNEKKILIKICSALVRFRNSYVQSLKIMKKTWENPNPWWMLSARQEIRLIWYSLFFYKIRKSQIFSYFITEWKWQRKRSRGREWTETEFNHSNKLFELTINGFKIFLNFNFFSLIARNHDNLSISIKF